MMNLDKFKAILKRSGVRLFVGCKPLDQRRTHYVDTGKKRFLEAIGADVCFDRGGLHDTTIIKAVTDDDGDLYVD